MTLRINIDADAALYLAYLAIVLVGICALFPPRVLALFGMIGGFMVTSSLIVMGGLNDCSEFKRTARRCLWTSIPTAIFTAVCGIEVWR